MKIIYPKVLLLLFVASLLTACGEEAVGIMNATPAGSHEGTYSGYSRNEASLILQQLEQALNQGELENALSLFNEDALVEVKNPPYWKSTENGNQGQLAKEEIEPEHGVILGSDVNLSYKGREAIKLYLTSLLSGHFRSEASKLEPGEASEQSVLLNAYVAMDNCQLQMLFKATTYNGQFQSLTIQNSDLVQD
jgi:hypothetical protein